VDDAVSVLSSLDCAKATGCDGLSVKILKACPLGMGRLLVRVINQSISSHSFPKLWKHAIVTPVQKSKNSSALTNFRPISVLPVFSKVLECVIHNQLVLHFVKCNLFSHYQSGFLPSHSTQDVLLYVDDPWRKAIDAHKFVISAFLDLAKAFDCVDHSILLDKLSHYGIVDDSLIWFESYLSGRQQSVKYGGFLFVWRSVEIAVPQGSILGPLLLSIFVNDLPSIVEHANVNMYADDTELHCCGGNLQHVEDNFQSDLHYIQHWLQVNRLRLNISKSVIMLIGSWQKLRNCTVSLFINGKALACVASTRYFGVIVDQYLTWKLNVDCVLRRVRSNLYALNRMKPLPGYLLCQLYQSFVLPIFDYCDAVWAVTSTSISKPLECLHSRFLRSISTCSSFVKLTLMERR